MRMTWFFFLFVSFWPWEKDIDEVKKISVEIPTDPALLERVRVALFYEKRKVLISIPSDYEVEGVPGGHALVGGPSLAPTLVRPEPSGIRVGTALYPVSGLRFTGGATEVEVDKKKYHAAIQVLKNPAGSLTVVNEIDVEDYLKGVVPREMLSTWPEEALKAQAVISRTYALFKNIENKDYPFTLSADVGSQVYGGEAAEHSLATRAVEKTRGEILTHRGEIFAAFFHSTCGGRTTRADYQWKVKPHPSLKGVECSFCAGSPFYRWKAEYSAAEIENLLAKKGQRISGVRSISAEKLDFSGRPRTYEIRHASGTLKLAANDFRRALGPDKMRSTLMQVQKEGDKFIFLGRGWGHGVGLCQWGAKRLAELGYRYQDILRYYYPDSEIRNVDELLSRSIPATRAGREKKREGNFLKNWFGKVKEYVEDL